MDSGSFRAVYNPKDQYHTEGNAGTAEISQKGYKMVTTDYVIDETYTGLITKTTYENTMEFDQMIRSGNIIIEAITPKRFASAQEIFRRYNRDKRWSFTDCTSYVVMKELKIKTVFAFDKNFEEMGFGVL